jgi:hypothetical protein
MQAVKRLGALAEKVVRQKFLSLNGGVTRGAKHGQK